MTAPIQPGAGAADVLDATRSLTAAQQSTLAQLDAVKGSYYLGLGDVPGCWSWWLNGQSVTRHVNVLLKVGILTTDAVAYSRADGHPSKRTAKLSLAAAREGAR